MLSFFIPEVGLFDYIFHEIDKKSIVVPSSKDDDIQYGELYAPDPKKEFTLQYIQ